MSTILVPVDFSDITTRVMDVAADLAKTMSSEVVLLHVAAPDPEFVGYGPGPQSVRDAVAGEIREEHKHIQAYERELVGRGLKASALLIQGYPGEKILAEARRLQASFIVMGSHGHSMLRHLLVGSVTDGVLRNAPCPVVVVPTR